MDLVRKALYLGVGIASYAAEKAQVNLKDLQNNAQKLVDTLVERGEMSAEEARRYVDQLIQEAQQGTVIADPDNQTKEPRRIEIIVDEDEQTPSPQAEGGKVAPTGAKTTNEVEQLQRQVEALQAELKRLRRDG